MREKMRQFILSRETVSQAGRICSILFKEKREREERREREKREGREGRERTEKGEREETQKGQLVISPQQKM